MSIRAGFLTAFAPLLRIFSKNKGSIVLEAVTEEGVRRDTLDRCAVIAASKSNNPMYAGLLRYCGDVGAPPDRFAEVDGLGVSSQFSGQMIHLGNAEYLNGLQIQTPPVSGSSVFVALEGRLLGYYRLLNLGAR